MFDEYSYNFMLDIKGPEFTDLVKAGSDLLDELDYFEHTLLIEQQIAGATTETIESSVAAENIYSIVLNGLKYHVQTMSVTLSEDITLSQLLIVTQALVGIEFYDDTTVILNILSTDEIAVEKLLRIISEITTIDAIELACYITDVSDDFLTRIEDVISDQDPVALDEEALDAISEARKLSFIKGLGVKYSEFGTSGLIDKLPFEKVSIMQLLDMPTQHGEESETVRRLVQVVATESSERAASLIHLLYAFDVNSSVEDTLNIDSYTFLDAIFEDPMVIGRVYTALKKLL